MQVVILCNVSINDNRESKQRGYEPILNPKKKISAIGCDDSDNLWKRVRL